MPSLDPTPSIVLAGSQGLLLDAASNHFSEPVQQRVLATAKLMAQWPGVREVVPGMNTLLVVYSPADLCAAALTEQMLHAWSQATVNEHVGREIDVPVIYGGPQGEDLAMLAEQAGMEVQTFIALHSEAVYQVACIGAMPGFPYLSGLNPALATPRRSVPRMRLEQGAIVIGGAQAGIMPCAAPSGWHVIGHTELKLFDPLRECPALLQPGDRVRFRRVGVES